MIPFLFQSCYVAKDACLTYIEVLNSNMNDKNYEEDSKLVRNPGMHFQNYPQCSSIYQENLSTEANFYPVQYSYQNPHMVRQENKFESTHYSSFSPEENSIYHRLQNEPIHDYSSTTLLGSILPPLRDMFNFPSTQDSWNRSGPSNEKHSYHDFKSPNTSTSANSLRFSVYSPWHSQGLLYSNNNTFRNWTSAAVPDAISESNVNYQWDIVSTSIKNASVTVTAESSSNLCSPTVSCPNNSRGECIGKSKLPKKERVCSNSNCKTTETSLWRRKRDNREEILCNACGLYFNLYSKDRPQTLKKDIIQTRKKKKKV